MDFAISKEIRINAFTDFWGPFSFDLAPSLPAGDTLTPASTVKSFLANSDTETTEGLIEAGSIGVESSAIALRLQYPGAAVAGLHEIHFLAALASGARQRFVFKYVAVI